MFSGYCEALEPVLPVSLDAECSDAWFPHTQTLGFLASDNLVVI